MSGHPGYPWSEGDPLFASALNGAFLPMTGGGPITGQVIIGSPFAQTEWKFNPVNPRNGTGAMMLNKVSGSAIGDDPQISSYWALDYDGGAHSYHAKIETSASGNSGVWSLFNPSYFRANNTGTNNGHVGFYSQQVRTGINAGGTSGINAWSGVMELRSQTGLPSSQDGILQTLELDLFANGVDDHAPSIGRTIVSCVIGQDNVAGAAVEVSYGISFFLFSGHTGHYKEILGAAAPFSKSVISTIGATQMAGANAVWLKDGHTIALNTAGNVTLSSDGNHVVLGKMPTNAATDAAAASAGVPVGGVYRNASALMVRVV